MRITSKGQVTIPQHIRERCGLLPGTEIDFVVETDGRVVLVELDGPGPGGRQTRGDRIVETLRGRAGSGLSTDEWMQLVRGYDDDDPGLAEASGREVA